MDMNGRTIQVRVTLNRPLKIVDTNSSVNDLVAIRRNPNYGTLIKPFSDSQKRAAIIHRS